MADLAPVAALLGGALIAKGFDSLVRPEGKEHLDPTTLTGKELGTDRWLQGEVILGVILSIFGVLVQRWLQKRRLREQRRKQLDPMGGMDRTAHVQGPPGAGAGRGKPRGGSGLREPLRSGPGRSADGGLDDDAALNAGLAASRHKQPRPSAPRRSFLQQASTSY